MTTPFTVPTDGFKEDDRVVYSNGFDPEEYGTVTSVNRSVVFVKYDTHPNAVNGTATSPEDLKKL